MSIDKRCAQGGKRGIVTKGGLICRNDGEVARVTSIKGAWGYWVNGRRTEPFDSREAAVDAFLSDVPLGLNLDAAIRAYQERDPNEFTAEWMPRVLRAAFTDEGESR